MWGDVFMSGGRQIGTYFAARAQAKADRKWQAYNNAMTRLQGAMNQNALTVNALLARRKFLQSSVQIQQSEFATKASVELAAAAAGTVGRSVNIQLFDVSRTAQAAHNRNRQELNDSFLDIEHKREQVAMGVQTNLDLRSIPSPSPLTHMLGFAGDMLSNKEVRQRLSNG